MKKIFCDVNTIYLKFICEKVGTHLVSYDRDIDKTPNFDPVEILLIWVVYVIPGKNEHLVLCT